MVSDTDKLRDEYGERYARCRIMSLQLYTNILIDKRIKNNNNFYVVTLWLATFFPVETCPRYDTVL